MIRFEKEVIQTPKITLMGIILLIFIAIQLNKVWFDVNDQEYVTEYIDLHDDHIVIFDRVQTYSGHNYSYGVIYYEDIKHTFIYGNLPKSAYKMKIYLNRKRSGKTIYDGGNLFFVHMTGYPEKLIQLLLNDYKAAMKIR